MSHINFAELEAKCSNDTGRAWLRKYIHPPSVASPSYTGVPDLANPVKTVKHNNVIQGTMDVAQPLSSDGSGDSIFLTIPSLKYPVMQATFRTGQNGFANGPGTELLGSTLGVNNQNFHLTDSKQFTDARQAYQSTTFIYDQNTLTNRGMVYAAQVPFSYTLFTSISALMAYASGLTNARDFLAGVTDLHHASGKMFSSSVEYALSKLTDKSNVKIRKAYSKQQPTEEDPNPQPYVTDLVAIGIANLGPVVKIPQDIMSMGDKTYMAKATEGCFTVARMQQPINRYTTASQTRTKEGTALSDGTMWIAYTQQGEDGSNSAYWFTSDGSNQTAKALSDFVWGDFTATWVYFSKFPTYEQGSSTLPNICCKSVIGWELRPLQNSAFNPYATTPAIPDLKALETAAEYNFMAVDAVEAKYNMEGVTNINTAMNAQLDADPQAAAQIHKESKEQSLEDYMAGYEPGTNTPRTQPKPKGRQRGLGPSTRRNRKNRFKSSKPKQTTIRRPRRRYRKSNPRPIQPAKVTVKRRKPRKNVRVELPGNNLPKTLVFTNSNRRNKQ
nr:hypothetical protein [Hepelivirales sp.]